MTARKVTFLIITTLLFLKAAPSFALETPFSPKVGISVLVEGENVKTGNIVSIYDGKYVLSSREYDSNIVGVVDENASVLFDTIENTGSLPIVSNGEAYVLVSTVNGPIIPGDVITASSIKGVGMKAVKSGIALGQALEKYDNTDTNAVGEILVSVSIHSFSGGSFFADLESSLLSLVKGGTLAATDAPSKFLKYIFASLVGIISLILGVSHFGKTARSGVEAIGRNPLAQKTITAGIIMNIGLTVAVTVAGLLIAYLILRL